MHEYKYVQQIPCVSNLTGIAERSLSLTAPEHTYGTATFLRNSAVLLSVRQVIETEGKAGRDVWWCTDSYCTTKSFVPEYDDDV